MAKVAVTQHMLPDILRLDTVIGAEKPIPEEIDHRDDTGANSFQREIVDRAVLSLKDAGVPSFLIE